MLIAESLDVGAGLQICSISNNNFNKPAPTWFLLSTQHSALSTQHFAITARTTIYIELIRPLNLLKVQPERKNPLG